MDRPEWVGTTAGAWRRLRVSEFRLTCHGLFSWIGGILVIGDETNGFYAMTVDCFGCGLVDQTKRFPGDGGSSGVRLKTTHPEEKEAQEPWEWAILHLPDNSGVPHNEHEGP